MVWVTYRKDTGLIYALIMIIKPIIKNFKLLIGTYLAVGFAAAFKEVVEVIRAKINGTSVHMQINQVHFRLL